jgi:tRNA pseudouridine13 synthase
MYIEKSLLRALHHSGQSSNYLNAIQSLPSSNVQLYLHAVQSLVFNMVLSERVKQHGLHVMVGDLVEVGEDVAIVETEEQAAQYSINDVVLTLVGNSVKLSPLMEPFYEESLQTLFGLSVADMRNKNFPGMIQLKGAYRKILATARNLKWAIHDSVIDSDTLIRSDVDVLKNEEPRQVNPTPAICEPYKAVVFECDLDSGVYLTMALREVTEATELARDQTKNSTEPNSNETIDS